MGLRAGVLAVGSMKSVVLRAAVSVGAAVLFHACTRTTYLPPELWERISDFAIPLGAPLFMARAVSGLYVVVAVTVVFPALPAVVLHWLSLPVWIPLAMGMCVEI